MTFREKHLWITIATALGVWAVFFWRLGERVAGGGLGDDRFAGDMSGLFVWCLIIVIGVEIVLNILAAVTTRKADREAKDERETYARHRSGEMAYVTLFIIVGMAACAAYFGGMIGGNLVDAGVAVADEVGVMVLVANVLFACLILSELLRAAFELTLLRIAR
ncbi:hypothetical protein [Brevundimonas sp.]|uniref:hypothetical protein n=1 Tax=Brevundimonas sp. TaxID=1871086 RepID=UPI00356AC52F